MIEEKGKRLSSVGTGRNTLLIVEIVCKSVVVQRKERLTSEHVELKARKRRCAILCTVDRLRQRHTTHVSMCTVFVLKSTNLSLAQYESFFSSPRSSLLFVFFHQGRLVDSHRCFLIHRCIYLIILFVFFLSICTREQREGEEQTYCVT